MVLDFNGTLACDGKLIAEVPDLLQGLSLHLTNHVLTADVVCRDIASALGLLLNPLRLAATLRV